MLTNFEFNKVRSAADLYSKVSLSMGIAEENAYFDRKSGLNEEQYAQALSKSTTLYIGDLSPVTFENYLVQYFS